MTAGIEASFVEYVRALRRQLPGPYLWMAKALATGRVYWIGEWQGVVMHAQVHPLYMVDSIGILPQAQGNSVAPSPFPHLIFAARLQRDRFLTTHQQQRRQSPHTHDQDT